jgi:DNA invertase Pin-like site-specific DNA recombinase
VTRVGFERMVAEVCLGKVGAVAAREVSRFARNSRDWQQLIEMCRVVDTVLIDQEMFYAPRQGNDRLLLGLNGVWKITNQDGHTQQPDSSAETKV